MSKKHTLGQNATMRGERIWNAGFRSPSLLLVLRCLAFLRHVHRNGRLIRLVAAVSRGVLWRMVIVALRREFSYIVRHCKRLAMMSPHRGLVVS